ncbi:MAG: alpha/beta hydrolase [Litoreibacter sp.]|uniref:alpha/beta hydrolase n=1 Tax=Litoreibacter sp. TaxID=1969459 RepID=UPI003298DD42
MKCVTDIVYDPRHKLELDLYLPDALTADACVIYMHGGGFRRGHRSHVEVAHFAQSLTDAGFAMASISYRLRTELDAFSDEDQAHIIAHVERTQKVGLNLTPNLCGPAFVAAMEDLSNAIEYLWVEGERLGISSRKLGVLGISAGGIAGLSLAYPPRPWVRRVSSPDAVVAVSSAIIHPWRLGGNGAPCLMFHSPQDEIIGLGNAQLGAARAQQIGSPVTLIETKVNGHAQQIDEMLDGSHADGTPYMQLIIDHFARLREDH